MEDGSIGYENKFRYWVDIKNTLKPSVVTTGKIVEKRVNKELRLSKNVETHPEI